MEKLDSKINLWIRQCLIPLLMPNENESNIKFSISRPTGAFFISDLFFAKLHSDKYGDKSVVVKLPLKNPDVNLEMEYDGLFVNEILFYNEIGHCHPNDYPKCYIAGDDPMFKNVILLEDMRPYGYTVCSKKVNVDLDYIVSGLKAIGRLHGHTYTIKEKNPAKYHKIVKSICKIRYLNNSKDESLQTDMNALFQRLLCALRDKNPESEFTKKMCEVFDNAYVKMMTKCIPPIEPLATIVHGDCTMNNFLFRTTKDGKIEPMLIDFGQLMHSSPAVDVSTFLYMCCKREDIRDRIEELFAVYHDSLTECMKEHGIWDPEKYSRQVFWKDYRERAIFGYVTAAVFFRFFMIMCERDNEIPEWSEKSHDRFFESTEGRDFMNELIDMLGDLRIGGMLDYIFEK